MTKRRFRDYLMLLLAVLCLVSLGIAFRGLLSPAISHAATFTFVKSATASADQSSASLSVPLTNVSAGSLIVVWLKWEGTSTTVTLTDGTDTFVQDTVSHASNNDLHGSFFYLLSSRASGNVSYTATWAGSRPWKRMFVYQYTYGGTASFDVSNRATGTSGTLHSNNITTTGTDEVVFGGYAEYSPTTTTDERIAGVPADNVIRSTASMWDKVFSTTFTGAATASGNSSPWLGHIIAFKATGGAPNPDTTVPTVSLTAPANGAAINGTVTVSASASDNIGVSGVQFLLDGANLLAEDTVSPYSVNWDTTTASNGAHVLTAQARDAAGNTGISTAVSVTVDNQAPTGTIVINNGSTVTNSSAVTLTLSATDGPGTVTEMRISNTTNFPVGEPYTATKAWTLSAGDGTKTVYVQFKDALGNWSTSFSDTIVLDTAAPETIPPVISAVSASTITNASAVIHWITDEPATSQVDYGQTTSYGNSTILDTNLVTSHAVAISGLASQTTFNFRVRSKDASGNEALGQNNTFTTTTTAGAGLAGPLRTLSTNPNYFTDGSGKAVYLTGSHTWNNLQDWGTNGSIQSLDFTAFVNMLVANNHNFTFLWHIEQPHFCGFPTTDGTPPDFDVTPHPWLRTGAGLASDGKPKFDLTQFNPEFFSRLRARVSQLNQAGIYAAVYLFTGEWPYIYQCATDGFPFRGNNNVNGVDSSATGAYTMTAPNAVTAIQDAYVEKVIDTLNDLPNVIWAVSEEAPNASVWWNDHHIQHVKAYEATKPFQHPVGYGTFNIGGGAVDSDLYNSNADWVAPKAFLSPTTSCGTGTPPCKVNINDSDHSFFGLWNGSAQSNRNFIWMNFMTGNQTAFMDPYVVYYPREGRNPCISPVNGVCSAPDPRWNNMRATMGYTRSFATRMNITSMTPQPNLSSTGFALANTSPLASEILVYAPNGGQFSVNLSHTTRSLNVEWFNAETGTKVLASPVTGGSSPTFVTPFSPFSGDLALYIYDPSIAAPDTTPPTIPAGLIATPVSPTGVNLSWNDSTDNVGVTGYNVYRNGVLVGLPATTSFQDAGLARGTTYSYTVSARDVAGNVSAPSGIQNATTIALVISNVATASVSGTGATITWITDVPADTQIEYGATTSYGSQTALNPALVTHHSQVITGLIPNTLYHYKVISRDSAGNLVASSDFDFTTSAPEVAGVFQDEILISGISLPTSLEFLPNGDMLILELGGTIWRVPVGSTQVDPTPFLSLSNIGSLNGQQGLMDIVLDPGFGTNRFYYVFYTLGTPNRDRVSRFTATSDYLTTNPGSEFVVYQDPEDAHAEHHGGALNFGLDGKLYITTGDHFNGQDSQALSSYRGKILRINSDGTIPSDNPFADGAGPNRDEIWAYGFRNPFRAYIDPISGKFYIADVGGNDFSTAREEINLGVRGANYGWPNCEGVCSNPGFANPIFNYPHNGRDASITGGFIYHGAQFPPQYRGNYFYADYAQNWIRRLTFDANGNVTGSFNFQPPDGTLDGPYGDIVSLSEGPDGALYYVDLGFSDTTGTFGVSKIRRIKFFPDNPPPTAAASAQPTQGPKPLTVNFSSAGSSDPESEPLLYLWDFGDNTTSADANPVHTYAQPGIYTVVLTVSDGTTNTLANPIQISVGHKPVVELLTPQNGIFFRAGDVINFSGDATDTEDGALPASAFSWTINFLHAGHVHPALPTIGAKNGSFQIPTSGHDFSGDTRYEITVTVTDSDGLQSSSSVLIYPEKVNLSFDTLPGGLTINLDGIPRVTPFVYDTLVNFTHVIQAPNQTQGTNSYTFASWSDAGTATHSIVAAPTANQTYTATFNVSAGAPLTFAQSKAAFSDASGTTLTVQLTNVKAGSLIVAYVKWEGTASASISLSDGTTSTFAADALNSAANNDLHGRFYYLLSSTAAGTVTYTATWGAGRPYRKLMIYEYTYGGTVRFDGSNRATGTSGNLTTGVITTTGTDEAVFGSYGEYNANNTTNEQINGLAADQVLRASYASMWSKRLSSPFTGTATATGNSSIWIGNVIAFRRD